VHHALYIWRGCGVGISVKRFVRIGLQKDQVRSLSRTPKCAARINRPEVNQTKPKLVTVGNKIRADSAGYAPQA
jgi:hypothetical protein